MAQRRTFSPKIVDSDAFLEMPTSSREFYFQLGMRADDDGFVGNPRRIMKMIGATEDDFKILVAKRFILTFESGVIVIKHWRLNNLIRKDWHRNTQYVDEKSKLFLKENGSYTDDSTKGQPIVNESLTTRQHSIVKYSKVKENTLSQSDEGEFDEIRYEERDGVQIEVPYKNGKRVKPKKATVQALVTTADKIKGVKKSNSSFDSNQELLKLIKSNNKTSKIIASFIHFKGWKFENEEQMSLAINRCLKAAYTLRGYSGSQLNETFAYVERDAKQKGYSWSLETVSKKIQEIINNP